MSRIKTFATVALLGAASGACAPTTIDGALTAENNPSIYSVHQPVVQRSDFVLDLNTSGDRVPQPEIDRLHGWFDSIGLRYGDVLSVDEGRGYATGARADIARAVAEYGLVLADGAPVTQGEVPAGSVRVIASRSTAGVPGCPNWASSNNGVSPPQNTSTDYGCATAGNLAAMIANPNDLILGQDGSGNGTGTTASRAIRVYREGQPTGRGGLTQSTTTSGGSQ